MTSRSKEKTIHIIAGPTAGGKSARSLQLAAQTNGVIINADSMQAYDALPVLAAQPTKEDKQKASHELYGVLHPNEHCSAGLWREIASKHIADAFANGKTPIIVGGNGMYIKVLMEGLSEMPQVPEDVRARTVALQQKLGNPGFYEELKKRDPVMAARFHPNHTARLVRAYEILEATAKSLADWQANTKDAPLDDWNFEVEIIMPEREILMARCDARFDAMMEQNVLDEVKDLSDQIDAGTVKEDSLITKALGFKPLRAYLKGTLAKDEAIEQSKLETRQYAKRQTTWFRNQL